MDYIERKNLVAKLIAEDNYIDAFEELTHLLTQNPNAEEIKPIAAFLFNRIQQGNLEIEPETAEQFAMRGLARAHNSELHASIEDLDKAIKLDPDYDFAYKIKALNLFQLQKVEQAISTIQKAISLNAKGEYYGDLANFYAPFDVEKALSLHEKAVNLSPEDPKLWYEYAYDLAQAGQPLDALLKLDRALELQPHYEDAIEGKKYILSVFGAFN